MGPTVCMDRTASCLRNAWPMFTDIGHMSNFNHHHHTNTSMPLHISAPGSPMDFPFGDEGDSTRNFDLSFVDFPNSQHGDRIPISLPPTPLDTPQDLFDMSLHGGSMANFMNGLDLDLYGLQLPSAHASSGTMQMNGNGPNLRGDTFDMSVSGGNNNDTIEPSTILKLLTMSTPTLGPHQGHTPQQGPPLQQLPSSHVTCTSESQLLTVNPSRPVGKRKKNLGRAQSLNGIPTRAAKRFSPIRTTTVTPTMMPTIQAGTPVCPTLPPPGFSMLSAHSQPALSRQNSGGGTPSGFNVGLMPPTTPGFAPVSVPVPVLPFSIKNEKPITSVPAIVPKDGPVNTLRSKSNYEAIVSGEAKELGFDRELVQAVEQRRSTHKNSEKRRRDDLKELLEELRTMLPSLAHIDPTQKLPPSKTAVIYEAIQHIRLLENGNVEAQKMIEELQMNNQNLRGESPPSASGEMTQERSEEADSPRDMEI